MYNFILIGCPFDNSIGELHKLLLSAIAAEMPLHKILSLHAQFH